MEIDWLAPPDSSTPLRSLPSDRRTIASFTMTILDHAGFRSGEILSSHAEGRFELFTVVAAGVELGAIVQNDHVVAMK